MKDMIDNVMEAVENPVGLPTKMPPTPESETRDILLEVIELQNMIEEIRKRCLIFNEPYQSESSRKAAVPQNNTVLAPLTLANWSLQNAQCALEHKLDTFLKTRDRIEPWLTA